MASQPSGASSSSIPFVRGSSLATMQDFSATFTAGSTNIEQLQTNAFLAYVVLDVNLTTAGNAAAVTFAASDSPWSVFSQVYLNDPANQAIISPITGYGLYLMNKYLTDTGCFFDPASDPNYSTVTGTGATGGSFSFRVVIPVEHRHRDALGAVNNSAANQRYLLGLNVISSFASLYGTAPTAEAASVSVVATQVYWTSPPGSITTSGGSAAVQPTPSGLGTVGFVRYERHNEVSGGGSPQIQLNNVGDYISNVIFVLRNGSNQRDGADWPSPFTWWVNDFQVHSLTINVYQRYLARFYRYTSAVNGYNSVSANGLDLGVFPLPFLTDLMDHVENWAPASQYLPTDATTKLQIRGANFGASASYLEVYTRAIRPVSGAALFA